jgi:hypothetical protein
MVVSAAKIATQTPQRVRGRFAERTVRDISTLLATGHFYLGLNSSSRPVQQPREPHNSRMMVFTAFPPRRTVRPNEQSNNPGGRGSQD